MFSSSTNGGDKTHHSLLGVAQQERAAQQSLLAQLLPGRPGEKVGSWDGEEWLMMVYNGWWFQPTIGW